LEPIKLAPQEMTRVFLNLFGNGFYAATKRARENGDASFRPVLTVATREEGSAVEVRVRDNGIGVPPEIRDKRVTLASHAATIGIPASTWLAAGILIPFAFFGGLAGRPIGDRLGAEAFALLAIAVLAVAGAYTLGAAALAFATA
jgi:hypothetical protein